MLDPHDGEDALQVQRRGWRAAVPAVAVGLLAVLFVVDARRPPPGDATARVANLEADVELRAESACSPVSPAAGTLVASPGVVVVEEAREVAVDLPVVADDFPPGALVGVGIAEAGVEPGAAGVALDEDAMALLLDEEARVTGPGTWPIVVAYRPLGVGRMTLLGSMSMRGGQGYRPPQFTLEVAETCPAP